MNLFYYAAMTDLETRLQIVQAKMAAAATRVGRQVSEVLLIAVSKTHPPESVNALGKLGIHNFGENKVQEAKAKVPCCASNLRWHGIGHLQTNKVRDAVRLFDVIHSVDSLRLAQEIQKQADAQSRRIEILLEINVSGEANKFGLKPEDAHDMAEAVNRMSHLELRGLMTLAPYTEDPERTRPYFRALADLKRELELRLGLVLPELSMGMSGDFEIAIEEGSTMTRIGTALFGERPRKLLSEEKTENLD